VSVVKRRKEDVVEDNRTVWKFPFEVDMKVTLTMPKGATVLRVGTQRDTLRPLCLWAEVDPESPEVERLFAVRGTGHLLGDVGRYLGTVTDEPFVWHVYEGVA
jgi:hypothetical protein